MVLSDALWITGSAKSGKTETLIAQLDVWAARHNPQPAAQAKSELIFAANADNRAVLRERLAQRSQGQGTTLISTTPLAFFASEVQLFWPLIIQQLNLRGYFPYRLRPETEQALALRVWGDRLTALQAFEPESFAQWGNRILGLVQLAASSGTPLERLAQKLEIGDAQLSLPGEVAALIQQLALAWKDWCLRRGVLTYGLVMDLFGQTLLTHDTYLNQIPQRFSAIAADDVDNYPAVARVLFERCLDFGLSGLFTYSLTGGIRKGLGADPEAFLTLRDRCTEIELPDKLDLQPPEAGLVLDFPDRGPEVYALQTTSRNQLLQAVSQHVTAAVQEGHVRPQDIAIIGPGLDPIARYTLLDYFQRHGIPVEPLREQRSLQSSVTVRALLTLLAFVYPGLGHWIETEQVAEMLVTLGSRDASQPERSAIDPVRAGLLADYCFRPHPERPELLPIESYLRWDRLGYSTAQSYEQIRRWVAQQQGTLSPGASPQPPVSLVVSGPQTISVPLPSLTLSPVFILDRAIQTFFLQRTLSIEQFSALRQLIETAQHYWDVDARLRSTEPDWPTVSEAIANFIDLLRRGAITSNPDIARSQTRSALVLATGYQYIRARLQHPWQYWLDAGSQLWYHGGEVNLWGASLFLTKPTPDFDSDPVNAALSELVHRTESRLYLCHSELAVNGQIQMGPLTSWIEAAVPDTPTGSSEDLP